MKVRTVLAGVVAGIAALTAAPAGASAYEYVKVSEYNGTYYVNTSIPGQPLFGASVNPASGRVCIGFSYQVPFCTIPVGELISIQDPFDGQPPVVVDADGSDGSVGVGTWFGPRQPLLGVRYNTVTGELCAGFSYQIPICVAVAQE